MAARPSLSNHMHGKFVARPTTKLTIMGGSLHGQDHGPAPDLFIPSPPYQASSSPRIESAAKLHAENSRRHAVAHHTSGDEDCTDRRRAITASQRGVNNRPLDPAHRGRECLCGATTKVSSGGGGS